MERKEFIKTAIRWGLLSLLALMAVLLGTRATARRDCSACPSASGCTSKDNCPL